MPVEFREANQADLARIVAIYNESIPGRLATADLEPVLVASRQTWFDEFDAATRPIWVMVNGAQILGWVSLESFYGRPAYGHTVEISIYLANEAHHQGLGQQALTFVETQLQRLAITTIVAFIFTHNVPSQGLFKKNGFEVWGHLPEVAELDGEPRSLDILGKKY